MLDSSGKPLKGVAFYRGTLFGKTYVFCVHSNRLTSFGPANSWVEFLRDFRDCSPDELPLLPADVKRSLKRSV